MGHIFFFSPWLRRTLSLTHRHLHDGSTVINSNVDTGHLWSTDLATWSFNMGGSMISVSQNTNKT